MHAGFRSPNRIFAIAISSLPLRRNDNIEEGNFRNERRGGALNAFSLLIIGSRSTRFACE